MHFHEGSGAGIGVGDPDEKPPVPDEACRPRKNNSAMIKECNNGYLYEDGRIDNHCIIIDSEGRLFGKSAP